jgi:acyl-CoA thioesterase-1
VAATETFAAVVERDLAAAGLPVGVANVGIGGERTDQALARLEEVLALQPEVVTIMYGTNDSYVDEGQRESRLALAEYAANLEALVGLVQAVGAAAVLMTSPRWGDEARNGLGENPNDRLEAYVAMCREVASVLGVPLVDHYAAWTAAREAGRDLGTWTTDQCHPNPEGHAALAEAMLPVLRELVARPAGG